MITCKKCGNQIPEGNSFCPNCGESVNLVPNNESINDKTQIFEGGLVGNNNDLTNEPVNSEPTVAPVEPVNPEPTVAPVEPVNPEPTVAPVGPVNPEPTVAPVEPVNPEPTIQSFDNNVANPNIQSFDNNVANPNIQSFDNNVANPNIQSFDNNVANPNIQSFDNNVANPNIQSFDNNMANPNIQSFDDHVSGMSTNIGQNNGMKSNKMIIIFVAVAVVVIAAAILIIPNLGKKTITCSQEATQNGVKVKTEIITDFKSNKVDMITIKGTYTVSDTYKDYIDVFYSSVQEQVKEYEKIDGVKATSNKKDNVVSFSVTANRNSAEKLLETKFSGKDESPESFIKSAEEQGMTCTK